MLNRLNLQTNITSVSHTIQTLNSAEKKCSFGNIASLRGTEGAASKAYFSALSFFIDEKFGFAGRKRRPPTDCANAAMSFSYTLLYYFTDTALRSRGFDTFSGFMHAPHSRHRALSSDVMEVFRAFIADLVTVDFLNSADADSDFCRDGNAVYLSYSGRKRLTGVFEKRMSSYTAVCDGYEQNARGLILYHADMLAAAVGKKDSSYFVPFRAGEENAHSGDI